MSEARLVLVGGHSFIAGHVHQAAKRQEMNVITLPHDIELAQTLRRTDIVINFSLHPAYRSAPYDAEQDCDLRVALACRNAGASFVMLSTRRVYPAERRWAAKETDPAGGDETPYGQNKARTEVAVLDAVGSNATILRLSNVFGFEYDPTGARRTFFAQALTSLKQNKRIVLDMHGDTRRDYVPVEACAQAINACATQRIFGVYNLGSGFAVTCGNVARWIVEGYGEGQVEVLSDAITDEFYLDMSKWHSRFPAPISRDELKARCIELGRKLQ